MLFREIIGIYFETRMEHVNTIVEKYRGFNVASTGRHN